MTVIPRITARNQCVNNTESKYETLPQINQLREDTATA